MNSLDQLVYTDALIKYYKIFDISELAKGIYSLKLTFAGKSYFKDIIIE